MARLANACDLDARDLQVLAKKQCHLVDGGGLAQVKLVGLDLLGLKNHRAGLTNKLLLMNKFLGRDLLMSPRECAGGLQQRIVFVAGPPKHQTLRLYGRGSRTSWLVGVELRHQSEPAGVDQGYAQVGCLHTYYQAKKVCRPWVKARLHSRPLVPGSRLTRPSSQGRRRRGPSLYHLQGPR